MTRPTGRGLPAGLVTNERERIRMQEPVLETDPRAPIPIAALPRGRSSVMDGRR
jgi:hypothetical protein